MTDKAMMIETEAVLRRKTPLSDLNITLVTDIISTVARDRQYDT